MIGHPLLFGSATLPTAGLPRQIASKRFLTPRAMPTALGVIGLGTSQIDVRVVIRQRLILPSDQIEPTRSHHWIEAPTGQMVAIPCYRLVTRLPKRQPVGFKLANRVGSLPRQAFSHVSLESANQQDFAEPI